MFAYWLSQRAAGAERLFHFVYNLGVDDSDPKFIARFGRYPVNPDYYTPRPHAIGLRTPSDLVGAARYRYSYDLERTGAMKGYVFIRGSTP